MGTRKYWPPEYVAVGLSAVILAATMAGCAMLTPSTPLPAPSEEYSRGLWSWALAANGDVSPIYPPLVGSDPSPLPKPKPGDICPNCKGRGETGDNQTMVPCVPCKGTGRVLASDGFVPLRPAAYFSPQNIEDEGDSLAEKYVVPKNEPDPTEACLDGSCDTAGCSTGRCGMDSCATGSCGASGSQSGSYYRPRRWLFRRR